MNISLASAGQHFIMVCGIQKKKTMNPDKWDQITKWLCCSLCTCQIGLEVKRKLILLQEKLFSQAYGNPLTLLFSLFWIKLFDYWCWFLHFPLHCFFCFLIGRLWISLLPEQRHPLPLAQILFLGVTYEQASSQTWSAERVNARYGWAQEA